MSADRSTLQSSAARTRIKRRTTPLSPTRSPSRPNDAPSARRSRSWETDDDSQHDQRLLDDRRRYSQRKAEQVKAAKRPPRPPATSHVLAALGPIRWAARLSRKAAWTLLPCLLPLVPYLILALSVYLGIAVARSYLAYYLSYFPALLQGPLSRLADLSLPLPHLPTNLSPCLTLGIFCGSSSSPSFELLSAGAARTAATRAHAALDVFEHLLDLGAGESAGMSLEPVAVWELATAVRYTSSLDDRVFLSERLSDLGDKSREVKDHVIALNAQGYSSFHWVVHEFTRLEELITAASSPSAPRMSDRQRAEFEQLLSSLFDKISSSLGDLVTSLDRAIPSATLASDSAKLIFAALRSEESQRADELDSIDWFRRMTAAVAASPQGGKKVKALKRDLEITRASAGAVIGVWQALEETRESLVSYQRHVEHYKAGVVGFHLSGHGLSVEQEVGSLKTVMGEMRASLDQAKRRSSSGGRRGAKSVPHELPEA
ncbi:hypothetical protein JCM3775_002978 [Rhodotorula graminis]